MTFSNFAKMLYPLIGAGQPTSDFVVFLINQIIEDSDDEENDDTFNPISTYKPSMRQKIFNGTREISVKKARIIISHLDKDNFIDFLLLFTNDVIELINASLQEAGFKFDDKDILEECANLFVSILQDCASKDKSRDKRTYEQKMLGMPKGCNLPRDAFLQMQRERERWQQLKE